MFCINKVIKIPVKRPIINDKIIRSLALTVLNRNNVIIKHISTAKNAITIIKILFFIFAVSY
jgi:hypothetical protein